MARSQSVLVVQISVILSDGVDQRALVVMSMQWSYARRENITYLNESSSS
jgi:hypothetical protein